MRETGAMCMKTTGEARLCINSHFGCSVSFQTSRISTNLLQQIHKLLINKQYQRVKLGCCSSATGRSPASIVSPPLPLTICLRETQGARYLKYLLQDRQERDVGWGLLSLCCSAQKLGRKNQWTGQWWNWWSIRAISHGTPSRRGTERLEETMQRQQK